LPDASCRLLDSADYRVRFDPFFSRVQGVVTSAKIVQCLGVETCPVKKRGKLIADTQRTPFGRFNRNFCFASRDRQ